MHLSRRSRNKWADLCAAFGTFRVIDDDYAAHGFLLPTDWEPPSGSQRRAMCAAFEERVDVEDPAVQQRLLAVYLDGNTADDDLVFAHPQTGRPYDASKSRVRFKAALKRAELRDLRFHDLRHTYGTLMAAAGTPLRTLQGWMGHRDYKTTEIYADFAPDPTQAVKAECSDSGPQLTHRIARPNG